MCTAGQRVSLTITGPQPSFSSSAQLVIHFPLPLPDEHHCLIPTSVDPELIFCLIPTSPHSSFGMGWPLFSLPGLVFCLIHSSLFPEFWALPWWWPLLSLPLPNSHHCRPWACLLPHPHFPLPQVLSSARSVTLLSLPHWLMIITVDPVLLD